MKILFIGGTGNISGACLKPVMDNGNEVFVFNRNKRVKTVPEGIKQITGDIHNKAETFAILNKYRFDVVANFINFKPENVEQDIELFKDKIKQYIFISSASVYEKPPSKEIITESTPLVNPFWAYARDKIACEDTLRKAYKEHKFPYTVIRPSYTYVNNVIPTITGMYFTVPDRMLKNQKVILHGDGNTKWVMTNSRDFAKGFAGLAGNLKAIGESFHITSDEVLTWNQVYKVIADALGVRASIEYIPAEFINKIDNNVGASLLGDKGYNAVFDNSKIRSYVPGYKATISFAEGIRDSVNWYNNNPDKKVRNKDVDNSIEKILKEWEKEKK